MTVKSCLVPPPSGAADGIKAKFDLIMTEPDSNLETSQTTRQLSSSDLLAPAN